MIQRMSFGFIAEAAILLLPPGHEVNMTTETSSKLLIKPKVRGFICVTAHPQGCKGNVLEQIEYVKKKGALPRVPKRVLVIGASTGYGLASRITSAFAGNAATIGVFFEKPSEGGKPASAGWYNSLAFEEAAKSAGLFAASINGDAFSHEIKEQTIELIKKELGQVDLVVNSLASPRRKHPDTGVIYNSVLKPIGKIFTAKTLDTDKGLVKEVSIEPAAEQEIADTIAVMGGEDWEIWIEKMKAAGVLADNCKTISYSYIGPEVTWPVYKDGSIGAAKADLDRAARKINEMLASLNGKAFVSVNQAIVTQASSAIPVVPLYISLLFKILRERGILEGCIEQIYRLFAEHLYAESAPELDENGRIRIDDLEMQSEIQEKVAQLWTKVDSDNLRAISDFDAYKTEFLKLFGFGVTGVDYEKEVDPSSI